MPYFLARTDPATYSIQDFERDGVTTWDGVRNAQAVGAIKSMHPGDIVLIYHSELEKAIVALAEVVSDSRPDPFDSKSWVVDLRFDRHLQRPVTLKEIKDSHLFDDWSLVRQSRLSTMRVPDTFIAWLKDDLQAW